MGREGTDRRKPAGERGGGVALAVEGAYPGIDVGQRDPVQSVRPARAQWAVKRVRSES